MMKGKSVYVAPVSLLLDGGTVGGNVGSGDDGAEWQSKEFDMDLDESMNSNKWSADFSEE